MERVARSSEGGNPMTSPTLEGALALEAARADDRDSRIRAEGWRAGYAAALEAALAAADANWPTEALRNCLTAQNIRKRIRSLPIPEMTDDR